MTGSTSPRKSLSPETVDLATSFGPLDLKHPVLAASGCFAYGQQFTTFMDVSRLAGLSTKGISPRPRPGNPLPRICETASGMINSIGLENVGAEVFLREKLPFLRDLGISIWVNFFGEDFESYTRCARMLDAGRGRGIDVLEMNVSCPNIKRGGIEFGTVPEVAGALTKACVAETDIPIVVKLTPNASDNVGIAQAVREAGAVGVSMINTVTAMAVDVRSRRPRIATTYGGLSGPAIKPIALRMVHQVAQAMPDFPICGMGGILTGEDALEFLMVGARCVQVGTANFAEPAAALRVERELRNCLAELGIASVREAMGCLEGFAAEPQYEERGPWS